MVSVPGSVVMRFETPIGSTLPSDLRAKGDLVAAVGSTMRIVPNAIFESHAAERSSMPPIPSIIHAGIVQAEVYELTLPPGALP